MPHGAEYGDDEPLKCEKILEFCPHPRSSNSDVNVILVLSDGLRLDSKLTMQCNAGYEADTPRETKQILVCRPGLNNSGVWVSPDGEKGALSGLRCRGITNWCPELQMENGAIHNPVGHRKPGASASVTCNLGYKLYYNIVQTGGKLAVQNQTKLICDPGTVEGGGVWVAGLFRWKFTQLSCDLQAAFCPDHIPAYTTSVYKRRSCPDPVDDTCLDSFTEVIPLHEKKYAYQFDGNLGLGSIAE